MPRFGRTGTPRGIRRRRRNWQPRGLDERPCVRISRQTHGNGIQTAAGLPRHALALFDNHGERPRPEGFREVINRIRDFRRERRKLLRAGNVDNQRVIARPSLCRVNLLRCRRAQRIAAEPVDRLRREGDQTAGAQYPGRFRERTLPLFFRPREQAVCCLHAQRRPSCSFSTWLKRL